MKSKVIRSFIFLSGILLFVTAIAKIISGSGAAKILQETDPILMLPLQQVLWLVGSLELGIACFCLFGKRTSLQAGIIAWLATSYVVYRVGLLWGNFQKPCSCLGNITDALHIPPQIADTAMKIILAYLFIGSYAILFSFCRQKRQGASSSEPPVSTA